MDNPVNRLRIAWALVDCGWGAPSPPRYESVTFNALNDGTHCWLKLKGACLNIF